MPAPAVQLLRDLRAEAARLVAVLSAPGRDPRDHLVELAELAERAVAHVRSARVHALPTLPAGAATRAAAQLHELTAAADAVGDALAVLASAGLAGSDRSAARDVLARRVAALGAALPQETERQGAGWDAAALQVSRRSPSGHTLSR